MSYYYNINDVKTLSKKDFIAYKTKLIESSCKLFNIEPSQEKIKELKKGWAENYDEIIKKGVYDIGTLTQYFIKIKAIVLYDGRLYVQDEKNILYDFRG